MCVGVVSGCGVPASERARRLLEIFRVLCLHEVGRWGAARRRRVCVQSRARGRAIALDCLWIEGACSRSIGRQRANFELSRQARLGRMCCELRVSLRVQRGVITSVFCGVLRSCNTRTISRLLCLYINIRTGEADPPAQERAQKNSVSAALFGMSGAARSFSAAARRRRQQRA